MHSCAHTSMYACSYTHAGKCTYMYDILILGHVKDLRYVCTYRYVYAVFLKCEGEILGYEHTHRHTHKYEHK